MDQFPYQELYDKLRRHGYHDAEDASSHLAPYIGWLKSRLQYGSVLDIGCSSGGSLPLLGSEGVATVGVDVSMEAVAKASNLGRDVRHASATALPFEDASFDLVVSAGAIWDDWRRRNPSATQVPRILPVVFHHGRDAWSAPLDLPPLFFGDLGDTPLGALDPRPTSTRSPA